MSNKIELEPSVDWYSHPIVLITVFDETKKNGNIITICLTGAVSTEPPLISISIRPSRYSHDLIMKSKEFTINIPTESQFKDMIICGTKTGREVDKWDISNFTPIKCEKINASMIKECPINIECKVVKVIDNIGTHTLFIGEVVAVKIDQEVKEKSPPEISPLFYSLRKPHYGKLVKK